MKNNFPRKIRVEDALIGSTNTFLLRWHKEIRVALNERIAEILGHEPTLAEILIHGDTGTPANDPETLKIYLWDREEILRINVKKDDANKVVGVVCVKIYEPTLKPLDNDHIILPDDEQA